MLTLYIMTKIRQNMIYASLILRKESLLKAVNQDATSLNLSWLVSQEACGEFSILLAWCLLKQLKCRKI